MISYNWKARWYCADKRLTWSPRGSTGGGRVVGVGLFAWRHSGLRARALWGDPVEATSAGARPDGSLPHP